MKNKTPNASALVINKLTCSLVGQKGEIIIKNPSKVYEIYREPKVIEQFRCNYGLNSEYQTQIDESGLKIVGADTQGENHE